ncbi:MAG: RNA-directed DNA polymerase, partial [bacterium]
IGGLEKCWKCSICEFQSDGHKLNAHFKKEHPEHRLMQSLNVSNQTATPNPPEIGEQLSVSDDSLTEAESQQLGTATSPISERNEPQMERSLSPPPQVLGTETIGAEVSVNEGGNETTSSDSIISLPNQEDGWLYILPHQRNPSLALLSSNPPSPRQNISIPDDLLIQENQRFDEAGRTFPQLWAPFFRGCESLDDLSDVLNRCCTDWLRRVTTAESVEDSFEKIPINERVKKTRRNQSRQMQRAKQRRKRPDEAKRIQRMFYLYPKKAVRQVLGEKSPPYTGSFEAASDFLKKTYERQPISPEQCGRARNLYDSCNWRVPDEEQMAYLDRPPSREEIELKLRRATNTAPGRDGLEYRHLRSLDPNANLLEVIFEAVWRLGIPDAWRGSKTVPIYKKGSTDDYSNYRPISLLSTTYKLFSSVINQRLCSVASSLGWLSPEQKGFLPGVNGIQEHTHLLQTAVEDAKTKRKGLAAAWIDFRNAFGSVPHAVLYELFESIPIPISLRQIMRDIYKKNPMDFLVGEKIVKVDPSSGILQGDPLSTTAYNLAGEPLLRVAKSDLNYGYPIFARLLKTTVYADDIAVLSSSVEELQRVIDQISSAASDLGLCFNSEKCACLVLINGKPREAVLTVSGRPIRCLSPDEHENYLGTPIGAKLRFRPPTELIANLDKIADSLLAPWQKLEIFRSHLLPSLSHHLSTGRVLKDVLTKLDTECRKFLGRICNVPNQTIKSFFYADRCVGGLGTCSLSDDADIWTIARAVQLLSSKDDVVKGMSWCQLRDTIRRGFRDNDDNPLPLSAYLSGSNEDGLYRLRYGSGGSNLWSLARAAARRQNVRIDVSGDESISIIADDVSVRPVKVVRGLRKAIRQRHTHDFISAPHQGKVAATLNLESSSRDMAKLMSFQTPLSFLDWKYLHRSRLDLLPLVGYPWSGMEDKSCRHCHRENENGFHVLNHCRMNLVLATKRHDSILNLLEQLLRKHGLNPTINKEVPGQRLRPDVEFMLSGSRVLIDVNVPYDNEGNLEIAFNRKVTKYMTLGNILPLILGSLGSWHPRNDDISSLLGIDGRTWGAFRKKARLAAIQGSMAIVHSHLGEPSLDIPTPMSPTRIHGDGQQILGE